MSIPGLKPIIFYDIASVLENEPWSGNTIKTRYCLTFKGLPFQTVWLEFPEIKPFYEQHSLGTPAPVCTLPVIMDPNTNRLIADSFAIAQYLDEQYPDTPKVLPNNTAALIHIFHTAFFEAIKGAMMVACFKGAQKLNPKSKEYYIRHREEQFGIPWEQFATPEKTRNRSEWEEMKSWNGGRWRRLVEATDKYLDFPK
ncbi:hypothetical protein BDR07DRAFT_1473112 [Suillus spraguei]|nr:hypothetical protein BDR07DRAFT_1473112 [Suillus spraguei]